MTGVTRADVARAAGVSPALVSYVLNGGPRQVSARAQARILAAIEELDYRPNRVARALRVARTHSIGMIMPDYVNPHFAELAQALESEARSHQYLLVIGTTDNDPGRESELVKAFADRQMDGLILISAGAAPDQRQLLGSGMPTLLLDRAPAEAKTSTVVVDNVQGARLAVEHLLWHGRRRIACIGAESALPAVQDRAAGANHALAAAGMRMQGRPVSSSFSAADGYRAMRQLIAQERPDGVFVMSDVQALGALRACADAGINVGTDVSIVAFDGTQAAEFSSPTLTTVDQATAVIAQEAIRAILAQLDAGSQRTHKLIEPTLRVRSSCGC